jgi:hypothetical protein
VKRQRGLFRWTWEAPPAQQQAATDSVEEVRLTLVSRRRAGLDAPASTTTRTGRSARAGRVVTGMVAGRGEAVGATITRRAGGARARPCTQKAVDLANWLPMRGALLGLCERLSPLHSRGWRTCLSLLLSPLTCLSAVCRLGSHIRLPADADAPAYCLYSCLGARRAPATMKAAALLLVGTAATATAAAPAVGKAATACGIQYITVNDAWRATGNECCADLNDNGRCLGPNVTDRSGWLIPTPNKTVGYKNMGDSAGTAQWCPHSQETGLGGDRWFRFEGAGGDALPLTPPPGGFDTEPESCDDPNNPNPWPPHGRLYCGTTNAGWLSGWKWPAKSDCRDDDDCRSSIQGSPLPCTPRGCAPGDSMPDGGGKVTRTPLGRYPTAEEGVVDMTVCFVGSSGAGGGLGSCADYATVGVARCEGFLLWRLPYAPGCNRGYCTVNATGRLL